MKSKYIPYIFAPIILFVVGCATQNNATPSAVVEETRPRLTITPSIVELSPSATDHPAQTSTPTPFPTLLADDALEVFASMIEKESECKLPCWLGIVPGQTTLDEVKNNFQRFSAVASVKSSLQSAYIRVFFPDFETAIHYTVTETFSAADGKVLSIRVYASVSPDNNGNLDYRNGNFQRMWQRYFLPGIFKKYGAPEKIYLDTTLITADPAESYPFVIWAVYPHHGFLIRYEGFNEKKGEKIQICPLQARIEIRIWDVERSTYEEYMKNDEAGGVSIGAQPIENISVFTVESFYNEYKDAQYDSCFFTPISYWPH